LLGGRPTTRHPSSDRAATTTFVGRSPHSWCPSQPDPWTRPRVEGPAGPAGAATGTGCVSRSRDHGPGRRPTRHD
jgi:hypothetical protein